HEKTVEFSLNAASPSTAAEPGNFFKTTQKYKSSNNLIIVATEHYENEDGRAKVIRERLSQKLVPIILQQYQGKLKNEIGSGGCDPSIQGAIYYRDYWTQQSANFMFDTFRKLTLDDIKTCLYMNPQSIFNIPEQPDTYVEIEIDRKVIVAQKEGGWTPFVGKKKHLEMTFHVIAKTPAIKELLTNNESLQTQQQIQQQPSQLVS
ncbi:2885_t:CDS:2, partial [Scutellospora calospora]